MKGLLLALALVFTVPSSLAQAPAVAAPAGYPSSNVAALATVPPVYLVTDLGVNPANQHLKINEAGRVVGDWVPSPGVQHGFLWASGVLTDLGVPAGANHTWAYDINDAGQVAGAALLPENNAFRTLLWAGGRKIILSDITSWAMGINNLGQLVGTELPGDHSSSRAVLWEKGEARDLNAGGGSSATDINDAGQVVGVVQPDIFGPASAFFWQNDETTILPALGSDGARPNAINALGQVVGVSVLPGGGNQHAVLWENGIVLDLGTQANLASEAHDINDVGQAVGYEEGAGAVLWDDLARVDLNTLIAPDAGWDLRRALGVNNRGQIAGWGIHNGQARGFLLTPMTLVVEDLRAEPGPVGGEIRLRWVAPYGEGDQAPVAYDLRYSQAPITEATWAGAQQVENQPAVGQPGAEELHTEAEMTPGVRWYFAIKHQRADDTWSPLSNVPSLLDMGFRPQTDGYAFANFAGSLDGDLSYGDLITMFGSQLAVCLNPTGPCQPRETAVAWRELALRTAAGGHCGGFSTTSLRFFKLIDDPAAFQPGAAGVHDLTQANVRSRLAFFQVRQFNTPWAAYRNQQLAKAPTTTLAELMAALSGAAPDPVTLAVFGWLGGKFTGHAVTPYAVEERTDDWRVWIYDSNHPNTSTTLTIDPENESWSYPALNLAGNAGTKSLAVTAISRMDEVSDCPFCPAEPAPGRLAAAGTQAQVWLGGGGRLLISDSQGRRIGYDGVNLVEEIPGAGVYHPAGGIGIELPAIYTLPLTETYQIVLDGQAMTEPQASSLVQFGAGYAAGAEQIPVGPDTLDVIDIAPDGRRVTYQSSTDKQAHLLLSLDESPTQSTRYELRDVALATGGVVSVEMEAASGRLIYRHHAAGDGTYGILIRRSAAGGQQTFVHSGVAVAAGDIHSLEVTAWDGAGELLLLIDRGGDGTIDETVPLTNQDARVYLPLLAR